MLGTGLRNCGYGQLYRNGRNYGITAGPSVTRNGRNYGDTAANTTVIRFLAVRGCAFELCVRMLSAQLLASCPDLPA